MDFEERAPMLPSEGQATGTGLKHLVNLVVMAFAFLGVFAAFNGTQNLESSLVPGKLGYWSIASIYIAFCFGALFISPLVVKVTKPKYAMIGGSIAYAGFMAANVYPRWGTLIPAAGVLGIGASVLWAAQGAYMTAAAAGYAEERGEPITSAMGYFNGIFWSVFQLTQIIGNLLGAFVLSSKEGHVQFLFYIFLAAAGLGTLMLCFLRVGPAPKEVDTTPLSKRIFATALLMMDKRMLLLLPVLFYTGIEQGFIFGDFTNHLINETMGKRYIGFVMAVFGAVDVIASFVVGKLADKIPRVIIVLIGFFTHLGFHIFWYVWIHHWEGLAQIHSYPFILFITAGIYGVGDAVWNTFCGTMMSFYFTDKSEAAFSNLRLFNSLGFSAAFIWGPLLVFYVKQFLLVAILVASTACVIGLDRFVQPLDQDRTNAKEELRTNS